MLVGIAVHGSALAVAVAVVGSWHGWFRGWVKRARRVAAGVMLTRFPEWIAVSVHVAAFLAAYAGYAWAFAAAYRAVEDIDTVDGWPAAGGAVPAWIFHALDYVGPLAVVLAGLGAWQISTATARALAGWLATRHAIALRLDWCKRARLTRAALRAAYYAPTEFVPITFGPMTFPARSTCPNRD